MWEGVGDWTEQQHIDPLSYDHNSVSFPFSWAVQPGVGGPSLYWDMVFIPASSLQLIWTSCRWGYIIIWRPPTSCERHKFALNSTPRQTRSPLISWYLRPDAPVIYTGAFLLLTAWPGRRSICNRTGKANIKVYLQSFIYSEHQLIITNTYFKHYQIYSWMNQRSKQWHLITTSSRNCVIFQTFWTR